MLPLTVNQCAEQSPTVVVPTVLPLEHARRAERRAVGREARQAGGRGRAVGGVMLPLSEAMIHTPAVAQFVLLASLVTSITSPAFSFPSAVGMW